MVVETAPTPPPNVELVGIFIGGQEPEAHIKDAAQGNALLHVFKGDDVGGYTVSAISATEIILTSPEGEKVPLPLSLKRAGTLAKGARKPTARGAAAKKAAAKTPTAAGAGGKNALKGRDKRGANASSVRERLRDLRRKRREANKAAQ